MNEKKDQLKNDFFAETGIKWENSQGEPDIDYVDYLESKVIDISERARKCLDIIEEDLQILKSAITGEDEFNPRSPCFWCANFG